MDSYLRLRYAVSGLVLPSRLYITEGGHIMPDYKRMYFTLAAKVSDAVNILVAAQQQGEDEYVENPPQVTPLREIRTDRDDDTDT